MHLKITKKVVIHLSHHIKVHIFQGPYKNRTQKFMKTHLLVCIPTISRENILKVQKIYISRYTSALPRATSPEKNQLTGKGSYHHSQVQTRDSVSTRLDEAVTPMSNNGRRDYDRYDQQRRSHDRQDQRRDRYDHSNDRNDPRRDRYDRY